MWLIDFLYGGRKVSDVPLWAISAKKKDTRYGLVDFLYGGKKVSDVPLWALEKKMKDWGKKSNVL